MNVYMLAESFDYVVVTLMQGSLNFILLACLLRHRLGTSYHTHEKNCWAFSFTAADLRTVTVKTEGWTHLIFCLKDDTTLPTIHFHQGGCKEFMDCLQRCVHLTE